ncbi:unnamed protein product, partial [Laminaria digitata]
MRDASLLQHARLYRVYSKRSSMTNVRTIKTRLDTLTQKAMPVETQNCVA